MYRTLNAKYIVATQQTLQARICERFPESGLCKVSQELLEIAAKSETRLQQIRQPRMFLRLGVGALVVAFIACSGLLAVIVVQQFHVAMEVANVAELFQGVDAAVNMLILLSLAVFFLLSLETRWKRRDALRRLHELRSVAHVIDMHQLTKDPESVLAPAWPTPSSPQRTMTRFQLARYLDYCSEMLAIISKLAALHAQYLRDPVILTAVNDVESLASGLSQKMWQKIMILDKDVSVAGPRA